jgi:hypothetical protein
MDKSNARRYVSAVEHKGRTEVSILHEDDLRVGMDKQGHYWVRHDATVWGGLSGDEAVDRLVTEMTR